MLLIVFFYQVVFKYLVFVTWFTPRALLSFKDVLLNSSPLLPLPSKMGMWTSSSVSLIRASMFPLAKVFSAGCNFRQGFKTWIRVTFRKIRTLYCAAPGPCLCHTISHQWKGHKGLLSIKFVTCVVEITIA